MSRSVPRILGVTAALALVGVFCGALLGGVTAVVSLGLGGGGEGLGGWRIVFALGAAIGAGFGAVLAPLLAWIFLRRVSIGRAIAETFLGVLIGIGIGAIVKPAFCGLFALAGFGAAGIRLWIVTRKNRGAVPT